MEDIIATVTLPRQPKWDVSIDELVRSFRDALCALVPIAERVQMPWKEPNAYDDWDHMCEAIYRSIVIGSIEHAQGIEAFLPIAGYDRRILSYEKNSLSATYFQRANRLLFVLRRKPHLSTKAYLHF